MEVIIGMLDGNLGTLWGHIQFWLIQALVALVILWVGWKVSGGLASLVEKALRRKKVDETLIPFIASLCRVTLRGLVVVAALAKLGVETNSFTALIAGAGLAIGMALSGNLQNFAGGVVILIFRPIKVGEVIEAQGHTGKVDSIKIFHTTLHTPDNKTIIIPNGPLSNGSLVNYSREELRRCDLSFGIGYDDDIDKARAIIMECIAKHEAPLNDPAEPFVKVSELADSSVNFAVRVWLKGADFWDFHFFMLEEVKKAFDREGISIPYPQQDLHLFRKDAS